MNATQREHEYQRDEHRVHRIIYHLIWCPRRRKPVLVGPVAARCRELLEGKCAEKGWEVLALAIQPDHIHLFVRVWPSDSAAEVVKERKGIMAGTPSSPAPLCPRSRCRPLAKRPALMSG